MTTLTIRHTHETGTILEGSTKGDGSSEALKAAGGWRWSRHLGAWYIPQSRDKDATEWKITRARIHLQTAGFDVQVEIDNTARTYAEVEADKRARLKDRAEALDAKADRRAADAAAAEAKRLDALARVPEGGEPIKIGHHSEGRHRKAIDRAWDTLGQSVAATKEAEEAERRAEACRANIDYREKPVAVARRIERIRVEAGKWQKSVDSIRARGEVSERHEEGLRRELEKLAYWEEIHAQHIADGLFKVYTKDTVKTGDYVKIRGRWELVHKANPKTVAIDVSATFHLPPGSHHLKYDWLEVQDHKTSAEALASLVDG